MAEGPFPEAPEVAVETVACGLCGADEGEPYAESYDYEYGSCRNRFRFVRCRACGTVYLNPRPVRDALSVIYPGHYYAYHYDEQVNAVARKVKAWLDARTFRAIRRQLDVELTAYLDIGCGNGRYLRALAAEGVAPKNIYGIELDEAMAEKLAAEGFQMRSCPFEEAGDLPEGRFALITLFSVLEHMPSPRAALARARSLLAPGGLIVFEVPNIGSLNARLFRDRYWGGYHTPRHWNLFSPATLRRVVPELGYEVRRVRMTTGHAFWLWSLHHWLRYARGRDRLGRWFTPARCLPGLAVVTPLDMIRARLGMQTDNMLVTLAGACRRRDPHRVGAGP